MAKPARSSHREGANPTIHWFTSRPRLTLTLAVLVLLGPFITKPFNIDDPLFLWAAKQIQAHPTNPYGCEVNWYGTLSPLWQVTKNPPLACYYLAVAAGIVGWSEAGLHLAFLLPAVTAVLGTYRLARQCCTRPMWAALAALLTPVFLISSTTIMCDTLMLAFWVWAVALWMEGLERGGTWRLVVSGLLMALAALTKYYGACLIPLLAVYGLIRKRRLGFWSVNLLIPIAALAAYQWATSSLYGRGLLSDAGGYAMATREHLGLAGVAAGLTVLAFTGGGFAVATLLTPVLWRPKALAGLAGLVAVLALVVFSQGSWWQQYNLSGWNRAQVGAQVIFWAIGGASVLALAAADVWQRREAISWLLALWVFGTVLFAGGINWIVNARSILPMAPAVGILLVRRLERSPITQPGFRSRAAFIGVAAGTALAVLVTRAEVQLARAVRQSAQESFTRYRQKGETVWFEGHWGFQYYLEKLGATAVDGKRSAPSPGDLLMIPINNSNVTIPDSQWAQPWTALIVPGSRYFTTHHHEASAGFHASLWGPLPFAFGHSPPEKVLMYVIRSASSVPKGAATQ